MKRWSRAVIAVALLTVVEMRLSSQGRSQNQAPRPAATRADEMLEAWSMIGNNLVAMAQDFREESTTSDCKKTGERLLRTFSTSPPSTTT